MPCYAHGLIGGSCIWGYMGDIWGIYGGWDYSDGHEDPGPRFSILIRPTARQPSLALAAGEQGCPIRQNQSLGMKLTRVVDEANKTVRKLWNESKEVQWCLDWCAAQPNVSFLHTCYISYISTLLKSLHDIHAFHTPVIRVKWASCHRGRSHLVGDFNTSSKQNYASGISCVKWIEYICCIDYYDYWVTVVSFLNHHPVYKLTTRKPQYTWWLIIMFASGS